MLRDHFRLVLPMKVANLVSVGCRWLSKSLFSVGGGGLDDYVGEGADRPTEHAGSSRSRKLERCGRARAKKSVDSECSGVNSQ